MKNTENLPTPRGRNILDFRTAERTTTTCGRTPVRTPIDTYSPTVKIPVVADRVITPDRPTAPTLPHPDTEPSVPEQAPQKPKKHTVRNIALAGTALGALGIGVYEGYQNIPAVHRAVDWAFLDHLRGKSPEASINIKGVKPYNPNFDGEQTVQIGSNTRPTTEEEKKIFLNMPDALKLVPGEFQPRAPIMIPGDNLQPGDVVKVEKNYNSNILNPITNRQERTQVGHDFTYSKTGVQISLSFIPGIDKAKKIEVYQRKPWPVNGKDYFTGILVIITMPDGTKSGTSIGASVDVRDMIPLIDNFPIFPGGPKDNLALREGRYDKPGLEVTPETPLVETARENAVITVSLGSTLLSDDSGNLLLNQK